MDFGSQTLCSIQRGVVKRQLAFSLVRSCDDGAGSRFSISFKGHHDYELEAMSLEDKNKVCVCVCVTPLTWMPLMLLLDQIMQLVAQIIQGNIYSAGAGEQAGASLREGVLLLHRGGLASFRWVKYGGGGH